jgi:predicted PurR-regulated permease PerM
VATGRVVALLLGAATMFGTPPVRLAGRGPEMINMSALQLVERDPATESVLTRARDALQELDHAADQLVAAKPPARPGRRAHSAAALAPLAVVLNNHITEGATAALRETAVSGSSVLITLAGNISIILFIAFFVLTGGQPLAERFFGRRSDHPEVHARARRAALECARQIHLYAGVLLLTNTLAGAAAWLSFSLADLPAAVGWGVTTAVLHVVSYLGPALIVLLKVVAEHTQSGQRLARLMQG